MPLWQIVVIVCAVAVSAALVLALLGLVRVTRRLDGLLAIVEEELRPLIGQAHGLIEDVRGVTREAGHEVERLGAVTEHVNEITAGIAKIVTAVSLVTRAGQIVSLAGGLRRGVTTFARRLRRGGP